MIQVALVVVTQFGSAGLWLWVLLVAVLLALIFCY